MTLEKKKKLVLNHPPDLEHDLPHGDGLLAVHGGDLVKFFLHRTSYYGLISDFGQKKFFGRPNMYSTYCTVQYCTVQYSTVRPYCTSKSKLGQYKVLSF